jgi:hypothetical protein
MLRIDTSGGNVTHAAVSLAQSLGARRITVYGADFSYPDGKAYARGTYLYDHFWAGQNRLSPAETKFYSFVHASSLVRDEAQGGKGLYTTTVLRGYYQRFLRLMETIDAEVIAEPGAGLNIPLRKNGATHKISTKAAPELAQTNSTSLRWRDFLSEYAKKIEGLQPPVALSNGHDAELWGTILPVAARVVREGFAPGPGALEEARRWSLERIRRVLQTPPDWPRP